MVKKKLDDILLKLETAKKKNKKEEYIKLLEEAI